MLIGQALELARDLGASGVNLREAARRVGVSHAAAYHHFPDKRAIIAAAATEGMGRLAQALEGAASVDDDDAQERICRIASTYVEFALREPGAFRLMFANEVAHKARFPDLRQASDAATAPLVRALGQWRAEANAPTAGSREMAVSIWSLVHGLSVLALDAQLDEGELRLSGQDHAEAARALVRRAVRRQLRGGAH